MKNCCDSPLVGFPSVLLSISLMSLKGMASGACGYRVTSIAAAAAAAPAAWRVVPAGGGVSFPPAEGVMRPGACTSMLPAGAWRCGTA